MEDNKTNPIPNGGAVGNGTDGANAEIELQRKIDRAVTQALATQKAKLDKEHGDQLAELQNKLNAFAENGLTDAEKAAKSIKDANEAKQNYETKLKRLEVNSEFGKAGIEESDYAPVVDDLFKGDFKSATSKIAAVIEKRATALAEKKYNDLAAKIPDAKTGTDGKVWTKAEFQKLTYSQQMHEISKNPELEKLI